MRLPATARTLALSLALAAAAAPAAAQSSFTPTPAPSAAAAAASSAAAMWSGVYRIDVAKGDEVLPMRVVVERMGPAGVDGTVLLGGTASALANVRLEGGELRATMVTSSGKGELVLRQTDAGVTGTLKVGKATWSVTGERSA
jgi:hypothetical protein